MKERLKVLDYKYKILSLIFLFILVISIFAPLSGNDWISFAHGKFSILDFSLSYNNGGLLSDYLAKIFVNNKGIFAIVLACLMTILYNSSMPLFGKVNNKYHYLLIPFFILILGIETFSYNLVSVTGTVCYTIPSIMIILYFLYTYKIGNEPYRLKDYLLLFLIISFVSLTTVHLAISFLIINSIFYAYKLVTYDEFPKRYIILIIIQIIFTLTSLVIVDKSILYPSFDLMLGTIPKFINLTFSKNIIIFLFGLIPINKYLNEKLGSMTYKREIIFLFSLIPWLSLLYNFFNYSPVNLNLVINRYNGVFATENWYFILYYVVYMILYVISILHFIQRKKSRMYLLLLLLVGIITSSLKLVSPDYMDGNNILFIFTFIISLSVLFKEMETPFNKYLSLASIVLIIYYLLLIFISSYIDITRCNFIKKQVDAKYTVIEVKSNPFYIVYRYNPNTPFQMRDFKKFANLSEDKKIDVKYFGLFEKIERKVKDDD